MDNSQEYSSGNWFNGSYWKFTILKYGSVDADKHSKFISGMNENPKLDISLASEIDQIMKKHVDNLVHALDGVSTRLSQLETRSCNVESSVDDLKVSVGSNRGDTDGKIRFLENMLREVQSDVLFIKDKQEILEARLQITKLGAPRVEQESESKKIAASHSTKTGTTFSNVSPPQPTPISYNLPQPPTPQNPQPRLPNQLPQQPDSYNPSPNQTPETPIPSYQMPPPHPQYQSHPSPISFNPTLPQPKLSHPPEETSHILSQTYTPSPHLLPPQPQQYYRPNHNMHEPPGLAYSASFGPSSGHGEPYPYSNTPGQHSKPQQQSGGTDYHQRLPTAQILPQALPTASPVSASAGSGGSGNRNPVDDIVDRVTNMGFRRDQVRATVQKLTESGQAADLNAVLDKLMTNGDGEARRGWFGQ
ncbi:uncharacterized protein LOC127258315 isoform X2 [Andrographis paniculata]|uniref:uncharacterized protein LOC127258315 isoform X2 n=1 Tax=Andrographis paniculata TaxID=175694 RepID=UPI0021E972E8|nr:uncharacterized protein LOC127258315 isoform X2 [Andrographis paniculata]